MLLDDWLKLLRRLPAGTSEVMVHPGADTQELRANFGWGYHWARSCRRLLTRSCGF